MLMRVCHRIAWHPLTHPCLRRSPRAQKNSTFASMEGYTLEGTKKTGMKAVRKQKIMESARKSAAEASAPAPKKK